MVTLLLVVNYWPSLAGDCEGCHGVLLNISLYAGPARCRYTVVLTIGGVCGMIVRNVRGGVDVDLGICSGTSLCR